MTPREIEELAAMLAARVKTELESTQQRLVDIGGIAKCFGVSERHIASQGLPFVRMGRRKLYDPDECLEYLKGARDGVR